MASAVPSPAPLPFHHVSVLAAEVLEGLNLRSGGCYLDLTVGGGGHSQLILEADPTVCLTAIDQDEQALQAARTRLQAYGDRIQFWKGNFSTFSPPLESFDGILADLGVSSAQFDQGERGFSFRQDAPLDMRMDLSQDLTAADLLNHLSERDLADLFFRLGEERFSKRIARQVVQRRPLQTTGQLASLVIAALPVALKQKKWRIHPATRVFQSLRMAVNRELESLETLLEISPRWLRPQGRLCIISFHSLEDRQVKLSFRNHPDLRPLTKKPLVPTAAEQALNPRSRSAKLRIAERLYS
ncbi:16S rRNA (cytosine(1402)-N(4))-methyltransferase RsmH [Lyngbya confervoides]|uniref:Ribosomal RNA small subunit methyltransferase H n=1 Tax=Lyngbya confervoides BDU141951 TaxID=1574623 RepID=A0ABD4T7M4_9CYAN|nr:16S rRNA (cytosine(1402)-N(4))-methyltransferase RsmH [Lyngbya confervoides]MCM1984577.1 16S rRNA (cytosine(1402)-N(4))-methyltransferase RsmH [Lyngbya confervoides BDU141951]